MSSAFVYKFLQPGFTLIFKCLFNPKYINKEAIPKDGAVVIAGNHKHALDPIFVDSSTKRVIHTLAKKELHDSAFGWFFRAVGSIPVDLNAPKNKGALYAAIDYLNEGYANNYADYTAFGLEADDLLTMPFVKSTEVLYYNADALEACNIEVPETWEELWAACNTLKKVNTGSTPLGYDSEANWFITMCKQNTWGYTSIEAGSHYLFDNDATVGWLQQLREYYKDGYFTTQNVYGSYTSNLFTKGAETGSVFSIGSSGGASHQATDKFKWGVAPIPGTLMDNGTIDRSVISQGPSLVMLETSADNAEQKKLMTWEFVKMLEDKDFQCKFAMESGYNPARKSSYDVDDYVEFLDDETSIVAQTALVGKQQMNNYYTSPAFKGSAAARTQVGLALQKAVTGRYTAKQALDEALKACGK